LLFREIISVNNNLYFVVLSEAGKLLNRIQVIIKFLKFGLLSGSSIKAKAYFWLGSGLAL